MKLPYMPLFQGDLLADTLHLSAQEFGAYMLLILHAWKHEAKVRVKDAQHIARVDNRHWTKVRGKLAGFFDPQDGLRGSATEVVHRRVALELAKADEISNKRKDAAMQMHAHRRASAVVLHMHPSSSSIENLSLSEEGEAPRVQMQPTEFRDKGVDYRAPPSKYVDPPLTDRPDLAALHAKGGK